MFTLQNKKENIFYLSNKVYIADEVITTTKRTNNIMKPKDIEFLSDDYGKIWGVNLYYRDNTRRTETLHLALCCDLTADQREHVEHVVKTGKTNYGIMLYKVKTESGFIGNGINGRVDDDSEAYTYHYRDACFLAKEFNGKIIQSHEI